MAVIPVVGCWLWVVVEERLLANWLGQVLLLHLCDVSSVLTWRKLRAKVAAAAAGVACMLMRRVGSDIPS